MIDVSLPNTAPTKSPRIHEFTTRILEKLKPLMEVDEEIQNHVMEENGVGEQDERTQGIKLLKTSELLNFTCQNMFSCRVLWQCNTINIYNIEFCFIPKRFLCIPYSLGCQLMLVAESALIYITIP